MKLRSKILEKIETIAHLKNKDITEILAECQFEPDDKESLSQVQKLKESQKNQYFMSKSMISPSKNVIQELQRLLEIDPILIWDESNEQNKHPINVALGRRITNLRQSKLKLSMRGKPDLTEMRNRNLSELRQEEMTNPDSNADVIDKKYTHWSTDDLVAMTSISRSTLLQIEDGSRDCTLQNLYLIAAALGVKPYQLLMEAQDWEDIVTILHSDEVKNEEKHLQNLLQQENLHQSLQEFQSEDLNKHEQGEKLQEINKHLGESLYTKKTEFSTLEKFGATTITTAITLGAAAVAPPLAPIILAVSLGLFKKVKSSQKSK